jgi:hypothetical protein
MKRAREQAVQFGGELTGAADVRRALSGETPWAEAIGGALPMALGGPELKGAGKAGAGALRFWEHTTPQAPALLRNPNLRGSFNPTDNLPLTWKGKAPRDWTPQEFAEVGQAVGVPNLGPESKPLTMRYSDGGTYNLPGGITGTFTYYDLLRIKADGIDPSRIPRNEHAMIQQKLMRTMTPQQPSSAAQNWQGLMFGMTSPNNPLFPNQLASSVLRLRDPALLDQIANAIPWRAGAPVSKEMRIQGSNQVANMLGIQSGAGGGLGVRGSTDYSRVAELAQMYKQNPGFFGKTAQESWQNFAERIASQVGGLRMKTGSLASVWQDPAQASISAIDRHMANEFERTGKLFKNDAQRADFEARAVERWNRNNPQRKVRDYATLKQSSGNEGFLNKMKLEYLGNVLMPKLRTKSGAISANVPPHLAQAPWVVEPEKVMTTGEAYQRAQDWNQQLAQQSGLSLFGSQWMEWDRIRRRLEPHENMFPDLERVPMMSREQLREVSGEHAASGHKTYGKEETDEGVVSLQPTRPRPYPAWFAYFTAPPIAAGLGLSAGLQSSEAEAGEVVPLPFPRSPMPAGTKPYSTHGYENADPDAVARGVMSGKVKVMTPGEK